MVTYNKEKFALHFKQPALNLDPFVFRKISDADIIQEIIEKQSRENSLKVHQPVKPSLIPNQSPIPSITKTSFGIFSKTAKTTKAPIREKSLTNQNDPTYKNRPKNQ